MIKKNISVIPTRPIVRGFSGGTALTLLASLAGCLIAQPARADICCNCFSNSLQVSGGGQVPLNQPVTITYNASFCRCVGAANGGPCSNNPNDPEHFNANCQLAATQVLVFLDGGGLVHSETMNAWPPTFDTNQPFSDSFTYTPMMAGSYTVISNGPCPSAMAQFTAGCAEGCDAIMNILKAGPAEDNCTMCMTQDLATPDAEIYKADGGEATKVRTLCPDPESCDKNYTYGETVDGSLKPTSGPTPDFVVARATYADPSGAAIVAYLNGWDATGTPAAHDEWYCFPWQDEFRFSFRGFAGEGSVSVAFEFWKLDMEMSGGVETTCWKRSSQETVEMTATVNEQCHCCAACGQQGCGKNTQPMVCEEVGSVTLNDVTVDINAGEEPMQLAGVASLANGDLQVRIPGCAESVIFNPPPPYLDGWVLGAPGEGGSELITITSLTEKITYRFEQVASGTDFRLKETLRADGSIAASYQYDATGKLFQIYSGTTSSGDFLKMAYDANGKLQTITPYVAGAPEPDHVMTLLYDGNNVKGVQNAACPSCGTANRFLYYDASGRIARITNTSDVDLERFTYDAMGRLIQHEKLNDQNVMVTVQTRAYADGGLGQGTTVTIREPISETQERVRIEHYDVNQRITAVDRFAELVAIGAAPAGAPLTTTTTYCRESDATEGIEITKTETTDPAGVTRVSTVKSFQNGLPLFITDNNADTGVVLPASAFKPVGMQLGDAVFTPLLQGATASAKLEVATSGTYFLQALPHPPANPVPGQASCIAFTVSGGPTPLASGYALAQTTDPPSPVSWLQLYNSCAAFGMPDQVHSGWTLEAGVIYTLTATFTQLAASPNPPNGWGLDGMSLARSQADPAGFGTAAYQPVEGPARYVLTYLGSTGGDSVDAEIAFEGYSDAAVSYLTLMRIDKRGGVTELTYDINGQVVSETGPAVTLLDGGGVVRGMTTYEYDDRMRLTRSGQSSAAGGFIYTQYDYDEFGRLIVQTENVDSADPQLRPVTSYTYSVFGEQTSITDPRGTVTGKFYDVSSRLTDQVVYAQGATGPVLTQTHYDFDPLGNLSRTRVAAHNGPFAKDAPDAWSDTTYAYDLTGRLVARTTPGPDAMGLTTASDYDFQGQLVVETRPDGSIRRSTFDGLGRLTEDASEAAGIGPLIAHRVYDTQGLLTQIVTPSGNATAFTYDEFGRVTVELSGGVLRTESFLDSASQTTRSLQSDPASNAVLSDTTYSFDVLGRAVVTRRRTTTGQDGPEDAVQLVVYDLEGRAVAAIDKADGNTDLSVFESGDRRRRNVYDVLGRVVQTIDAEGAVRQSSYDVAGATLSGVVDPAGLNLVTSFQLDALGRTVQTTDPEGHYWVTGYDSRSQAILEIRSDSRGTALSQIRWQYDLGGRLTQIARLLDPASSAAPNPQADRVTDRSYYPNAVAGAGQLAASTVYDGDGARTTTTTYDALGRRLRVAYPLNPLQNYEQSEYDPATGRIAAVETSDPLGIRRTEFTYDTADRVILQRAVGGGGEADLTTQFAYDGLGRRILQTAPDGVQTAAVFDLLGQQLQQLEDVARLARLTEWNYDRLGRRVSLTANDGDQDQVTIYGYDLEDRQTLVRYPDHGLDGRTGEVAQSYDPAGRLTTRTDQRGIVTQYQYDKRGLPTHKQAPALGVDDVYTYDGLGRMTSHQRDAANHAALGYNGLDQLVSDVQTVAGAAKALTAGYNPLGERVLLAYPADTATTLMYQYDDLGNNTSILRNGVAVVDYTYQGSQVVNRRLTTDQSIAIDQAYTYDHHRRITGLANTSGPVNLVSFAYDHDDVGNPLYELGSSQRVPSRDITYSYDTLQRLTEAAYSDAVSGSEHLDYDLLGNRVRYCPRDCDYGVPTDGILYDHNVVNEYIQLTEANVTEPIAHDPAGNLSLDADDHAYSYDFENRLVAVYSDANANGQLDLGEMIHAQFAYDALGRRTESAIGGVTSRTYWDGQRELVEYDAIDMSGPRRWYVNGTTYVDERAVVYTNAPVLGGPGVDDYYCLLGNLFSVAGLASDQGQTVEANAFDAYGGATIYRLPSDVNSDGDVDLVDYAAFPPCVSGPAAGDGFISPPATCLAAHDSGSDGDVDVIDFAAAQKAFTGSAAMPGFVAPGPMSFAPASQGTVSPFYFTGRRLDQAIASSVDLQDSRARTYSPALGRFQQRDPSGYTDGANLYEYVVSRPTVLVDPNGLQALTIKVIKAPTPGLCGKVEFVIEWQLAENSPKGGWVVQHVSFTYEIKDCKDMDIAAKKVGKPKSEYWEAWEVKAGKKVTIYSGTGDDYYNDPDFGACTKGSDVTVGKASFYENLALPGTFKPNNPDTFAGILPATITDPKLAGGTASIDHNQTTKWNCCPTKKTKTVVASHTP